MTKNASEILKHIELFNEAYHDAEYAGYMLDKVKTKKEREMYEEEQEDNEDYCFFLAEEIKKLKPSKYMINKHIDLQDILNY